MVTTASLVVATGGLSVPKIGATPFGYRLAAQFGLPVVPPRPALVPLAFAPDALARYGDLAGGAQKTIMHLVAWRVDRYADLPASIRDYLEAEAPMWKEPPRDIEEIRKLQR